MKTCKDQVFRSLALLALVFGAAGAQAEPPAKGALAEGKTLQAAPKAGKSNRRDRADLRKAWKEFWFGPSVDPEYLQHKARVAREEAEKSPHLFPEKGDQPFAPDTGNTWINLGPHANITTTANPDIDSGRVTAIAPDKNNPLILYVATSGGGVFKCSNADVFASGDWTWTPITDHLPSSSSSGNISVGALAFFAPYPRQPGNPGTLYLGMGDFNDAEAAGFFRSTDGGASWTAATGLGNQTRTYDILVENYTNNGIVLVGTNDGLKRSTDGGLTFSPVSIGGRTDGAVWNVKRCSDTDLICTRQANGSGQGSIWYSQDHGVTWAQATVAWAPMAPGYTPGRISLATRFGTGIASAICESNDHMAPGILRSSDNGHSWTFVPAPRVAGGLFQPVNGYSGDGEQGSYNQLIIHANSSDDTLFVGSNLSLYRTQNGGASWDQITSFSGEGRLYAHADFHAAAFPDLSTAGSWPMYFGTDGGLSLLMKPFKYSHLIPSGPGPVPSDTSFLDNRRNRGLASHLVYKVGSTDATSPADSQSRITLGLQDNGTRMRVGTGGTFEDRIGGDGFGTLIHPANGDLMLGSSQLNEILRSSDGGATFQATSGISEANNESLAAFETRIVQGSPADTVYTHTQKKVYRSQSFGAAWTPVAMTYFDSSRTIRNLAASASNPDALAVVTTGATGYVTTNSGLSWAPFGTFPNFGGYEGTSCVWFDTTNASVLYAGSVAPNPNASHIWRSANGGITWTAIDRNASGGSNGFPFGIPVHVIKNDPADGQVLFAGTDLGVYRSNNAGATWSRYGQGLPMVAVLDLYVSANANFVRAGTFGRGVWELRQLVVLPPTTPAFTTQPLSKTVRVGQTATFTVAASGNPNPSMQWQRYRTTWYAFGPKSGWVDIPGATYSTYTTAPAVASDNGAKFRVHARNGTGIIATSQTAVLTVQ